MKQLRGNTGLSGGDTSTLLDGLCTLLLERERLAKPNPFTCLFGKSPFGAAKLLAVFFCKWTPAETS